MTGYPFGKILNLYLMSSTKVNSRCIKDLRICRKTIRRNQRNDSRSPRVEEVFLSKPIKETIKEKTNRFDYIQIKAKEPIG